MCRGSLFPLFKGLAYIIMVAEQQAGAGLEAVSEGPVPGPGRRRRGNLERELLIQAALDGLGRSYAPYSHFHVSAALLCRDGKVYTGNNIENAAYSPGICAERCAFAKAVSEGEREFEAIVICGGPDGKGGVYCPPCGVCRQVMREFCNPDSFCIILAKSTEEYREYTLAQLLPESFGPDHLGGA